ncbi:Gp49 family protein [Celeribacter sp.]|uniref:Gp49 family protein n=1 Tax=Celeribacter sp. TaxID=1890673 RepID=UPI003A8CD776
MCPSEQEIEATLTARGKRAPRLTPELIDNSIASEQYWNPPGTSLTVCVLTLRNGFHVTGESASASLENFDAEIGQQIARKNAREKIWALEGYLLRDQLHQNGKGGAA